MTGRVERLLHLGRGELRPGVLLFTYLFLVSAACTAGRNTRDALFLARFDAARLPLADLGMAAAVTLAAACYMRAARSSSLKRLLVGSLLAFASIAAVFWWLFRSVAVPPPPGAGWLAPALYVWVGILGVLAVTQVWTLANYVLTLRQAKRLFALVGCGSILGTIAGGAATTALTRSRGAEAVLLAMAVAFVACAALVPVISRGGRRGDARRMPREAAASGGLRQAATTVLNSPYLRLIGFLIALAALGATLTSWQFRAIAQAHFAGRPDELNAFFGSFTSIMGICALAIQLLLTAPILRRIGLGGALSIVPLALVLGSFGLMAVGSLAAVAVLRGSDQALRYSIDKASMELLYLPLRKAETVQVKSFLDTVVCRLGDAVASVSILVLVKALRFSPPQIAWLTVALAAAWVVAARAAHREYLRTLADALREHRVDVQGVTAVLDRATTELLASHLGKGDSRRVLNALSLVEASRAPAVLPNVEALLTHASPAVRARAIAVLAVNRPSDPPPGVERLLFDPDLRVRSAALLYMAHAGLDPLARLQESGDFESLAVRSAMVVYLSRPSGARNLDACRQLLDGMVHETGEAGRRTRVEAARLLASLPNFFRDQLTLLLADHDPDVVRHAIRAAGRLRAGKFVSRLMDALADPRLAGEAAAALARFGQRIVPTLAAALGDGATRIEVRRQIPKILTRIGSPAAEQALVDSLLTLGGSLRIEAASALAQLKRRHPDPPVDPVLLDKVLVAEILDQYRAYLSPMHLPPEAGAGPAASQQLECLFRLLQLRLPGRDINSTYVGLQSLDPVVHDKALEFLDNILSPHLRRLLVPLIDGKVERKERAVMAARLCAGA